MKTIHINNGEIRHGYEYKDLDSKAKEKVLNWLQPEHDWYADIYEDAANVGIEITGFDLDRSTISGEFITSAGQVVEDIKVQHGRKCDTYKTAAAFTYSFQLTSDETDEDELDKAEDDFLDLILKDYLKMLRTDYEYQCSEAHIIGQIEANDYLFDRHGNPLPIVTHMRDSAIEKHTFDSFDCTIN